MRRSAQNHPAHFSFRSQDFLLDVLLIELGQIDSITSLIVDKGKVLVFGAVEVAHFFFYCPFSAFFFFFYFFVFFLRFFLFFFSKQNTIESFLFCLRYRGNPFRFRLFFVLCQYWSFFGVLFVQCSVIECDRVIHMLFLYHIEQEHFFLIWQFHPCSVPLL